METTELNWSLKVRCKRDAAEQALSLSYTAGSVTADCTQASSFFSFALLLFLDVRSLFSLSVSHIVTIHHIWSDTELAAVILGAYLAPAF